MSEDNTDAELEQVPIRPRPYEERGYLKNLNPEQFTAVTTTEGPVLVLAGAGTGKTRVLTARIEHILQEGLAYPSQILAVTFTNKAAHEIKERIHNNSSENITLPWIGTFHAISSKILRIHAPLIGLTSNFSIINDKNGLDLIREILRVKKPTADLNDAKELLALIDFWKREGLQPGHIKEDNSPIFGNGFEKKVYELYQERLIAGDMCDFNDLLLHVIKMFQENPELLQKYQTKFRYILIDEYQDINTAQYLLMRLLAQKNNEPTNFFCVGDEDQTIYKWRGAHIERILDFPKHFPEAKIIHLERNYRSTKHILGAASGLIAHNKKRYGKTLFAHTQDVQAPKVSVNRAANDRGEAIAITKEILKLYDQGVRLSDMAILVRMSHQTRLFEEVFINYNINYRIYGSGRFLERKEISGALAYFSFLLNPRNEAAFRHIINTPKRGIGEKTLQTILSEAGKEEKSFLKICKNLLDAGKIKGTKAKENLGLFLEQYAKWQSLINSIPASSLAEMILEESGYRALYDQDTADDESRRKNLDELLRTVKEHDTFLEFMEYISLRTDRTDQDNNDAINIMTFHTSKGAEFHTVFLPGWEEDLFPAKKALDENDGGLEEERRLAYVAITRAKRNLYIWFAHQRWKFDKAFLPSEASRFIQELPPEHVIFSYKQENPYTEKHNHFYDINYKTNDFKWRQKQQNKSIIKNQCPYEINDRINHTAYGQGTILEIEGKKLLINFDKAGEKRVLADYIQKADTL